MSDKIELRGIVTDALIGMIAAVVDMTPPAGAPIPPFIQAAIDRAVERIAAALAHQPDTSVPDGWKLVPVESNIDMEDAGRKAASRLMGLSEANRVYRAMLAAAPAAPVAQEPVAWIEGRPSHPWDKEWFIAELDNGDRVVLRALPEEYAYDLTTADGTYYRAAAVKQWMQFVDSEFVSVAQVNGVDLLAMRELLAAMNRDGGQRQNSVGLAQSAREALAEFHHLQQTLADQPDTVAVPRELLEDAARLLEAYSPGSGSEESYTAQDLRGPAGRRCGMSNRLTVMYRAGISAERVREITGADDVSLMTWSDVFAERDALRAEVKTLRELLRR